MSDEFVIASERAELYAVLLKLSVLLVIDAVMFAFISAAIVIGAWLGFPDAADPQILITSEAFLGTMLVGFYYTHRHYMDEFLDGGIL